MKKDIPVSQENFQIILRALDHRKAVATVRELPAGALFHKMWDSCADIAEQALQTGYSKGISSGGLDPVAFGALMVQDAYCYFRCINNFRLASYRAIDPAAQGFLEEKWRNYARHRYYRDTWRIREVSGVAPGEDLLEYADYGEHIARNLESPYFFCFMPPCEYLRAWIANRLAASTPEDSAYYFWIQGNAGGTEGAMQAAIMIENYRGRIDEAKVMEIFRKAMQFELAVLTAATAAPVARSFENNRHNLKQ